MYHYHIQIFHLLEQFQMRSSVLRTGESELASGILSLYLEATVCCAWPRMGGFHQQLNMDGENGKSYYNGVKIWIIWARCHTRMMDYAGDEHVQFEEDPGWRSFHCKTTSKYHLWNLCVVWSMSTPWCACTCTDKTNHRIMMNPVNKSYGAFLSHGGTRKPSILDRDFPWQKPSSYWGTPMTSWKPPLFHIITPCYSILLLTGA